jgi:hypothetical protein
MDEVLQLLYAIFGDDGLPSERSRAYFFLYPPWITKMVADRYRTCSFLFLRCCSRTEMRSLLRMAKLTFSALDLEILTARSPQWSAWGSFAWARRPPAAIRRSSWCSDGLRMQTAASWGETRCSPPWSGGSRWVDLPKCANSFKLESYNYNPRSDIVLFDYLNRENGCERFQY